MRRTRLTLAGNLLCVDPWVPALEARLRYFHVEFDPGGGGGRGRGGKKGEHRNLYHLHKVDGRVVGYAPEGLSGRVARWLAALGVDHVLEDKRKWAEPPEADFSRVELLGLRDGQEEALTEVASRYNGIIKACMGYGKTYLIVQICRMYPKLRIVITTPARSVVKTIYDELRKQPLLRGQVGAASSSLGYDVDKRVVVSTVQSLRRVDAKDVDLLLFDEVHGAASEGAAEALAAFRNSRKFGFSGTPKGRVDNADMVTEGLFGEVVFDFSYQRGVESGAVVPLEVVMLKVGGGPIMATTPVNLKRKGLWLNYERNRRIVQAVRAPRFAEKQVLVMVETVAHLAALKEMLPEFETVYVSSGTSGLTTMSAKELSRKQTEFAEGKIRKCIATMCWREGVNFTQLGVLVRADGLSGPIPNGQIPGRLSRLSEGKDKGVMIDFLDGFEPRLRSAAESRMRHYRAQGWKVLREGVDF